MTSSEHSSRALMMKVAEIVDGSSGFDVMMIFSWILGDMIVQNGADLDRVLGEFRLMVSSATEVLGRNKPEGVTLN